MLSRRFALISSTSLEAALILVATWLDACRLGICYSSAPMIFWT